MKRSFKLVWVLILAMNFQSTLMAVEKNGNNGFLFFKTKASLETNYLNNTFSSYINNALSSKVFSDVPLKIFLNDTVIIDGDPVYQSCINSQSVITFLNNAPDPTKNNNYCIKWGDGSDDFTPDSWENTTHQYTPSITPYTLVYSFTHPGGSFSKEYKIYVRSKPAFSFGTEGLTDNCVGYDIFFPIKGTEGNSLDTKYKITFNDGSDTIIYNPSDGKGGIFHKFLKSSCGTTSSGYQNAFSAKVKAVNACGISEVSVVPIYVSTSPIVGFSLPVLKNAPLNTYQAKAPIKITDTTTGFVNVNGNCSAVPKLVWIITPSTGFTLATGETLGKDYGLDNSEFWIEGTKTITPTFTEPGTYTIKLRVDTKRCGNSFIEKTICIENPLTTSFDLDSNIGCKPLSVKVTNTTDLSKTCTAAYKWVVTYTASNCGDKAGYTYGNGSSESSPNPVFIFNTPGTYNLKLTTINTAGSSELTKTVIVKQPPTVTINKIQDFCGSASIDPVAVVNSCDDKPDNLTYNWTFEGGIPSSSSKKVPETITYNTVGEYKVNLNVTNSCGTTIAVSNTFKVNPTPTVSFVDNQVKCKGELSEKINFGGSNANVFDWTNDNTSIGLAASGKGLINPFILQNDSNKVISANITVSPKDSTTGCIGSSTTFTIFVNPKPKMDSVGNQVINNGEMTSEVIFGTKNTGGTTTYNWSNDNPSNELAASGTGSIPAFKAKSNSNTLLVYPIIVTPTFTNGDKACTGTPQKFTITINPTAQINRPQSLELCNGAYTPDIIFNTKNTEGNTTYSWINNNTSIGLAESGTGDIKSFKLTNNTSAHLNATITVTPTFTYNGVSNVGDTVQFRITVDPGPDFTQQPVSSYICRGGVANPLVVESKGGVGTPKYQWYWNNMKAYEGGTIIELATNATFIPPIDSTGIKYYYCTVTLEEGNCYRINSDIAAVSVNEAAMIISHPKEYQNLCVGGTIKTPLTVSYNGGNGQPSYQWYSINNKNEQILIPGATDSIFTPPLFTNKGKYLYQVIVSLSGDSCGSKTSNVAEINVVNDPTIKYQPLASQTVCQNTATSNLVVTPQGGVESVRYHYQWYANSTNSNTNGHIIEGASDSIYTPLADSIKTKYFYCLVSQDSLSCNVTSETSAVTVNANPQIVTLLRDTTVCINEQMPALTFRTSGGVGTPTYQWYASSENNYNSGKTINDSTKNTFTPPTKRVDTVYYYCISSFEGGCSSLTSNIVCIKVTPKAVISSQNISICSGGSFNFIKSESDYIPEGTTYKWSKPSISPKNTITGSSSSVNPTSAISQTLTNTTNYLATATYTVTPTSGSCDGIPFNFVVEVIPTMIPTVTVKNSNCYNANNGSITVTVIGGKAFTSGPSYKFLWKGPNEFESYEKDLSNLSPGEYSLTITDNGGCPFNAKYTITEPKKLVITTDSKTDIKCNGDNTGQINISVLGGTPNYTFKWTKDGLDFSTNEDLSNLKAGEYIVTVKDANGCQIKSDTIKIIELEALSIEVNKKNISCFGDATGEISVKVSGGVPFTSESDYHYLWSGPNNYTSTLKNCTNLLFGNYTLTVTDQNGCSKTISVIISQPEELILNVKSTQITCYGANNGSISASITGGTKEYDISWSNNANGTLLTGLIPGIYTITVKDANGCIKSETITIKEANFSIHPTIKDVSCYGAKDGSINLNISGGVSPIKVIWSDDPIAGGVRSNLAPGTYTVHLQDGAPCVITETYEINQPDSLIIVGKITNAFECDNPNSGAITTTVSGGTLPYTYKWNNGKDSESLTNIQAGTYTLTLTDAQGCIKTAKFKVTRQLPLQINVSTTSSFNCEIKKYRNTNIAHVSGGVSPYKYSWSSGLVSGENNEIMENDRNNVIILQVTDAIGCTADYTFTINNPLEINSVSLNYQLVDCKEHSYLFDVKNAILAGNNNTYKWDFGDGTFSTTQTILHKYTNPGNYTVKLAMTNGICESHFEQVIIVEQKPKVKLDNVPILCRGESSVIYASGAYSYRWSDGSAGDSIILSNEGKYSVIGTSVAGCKDTLNFVATYYNLLNYVIHSDKTEIDINTPLHLYTENIAYSKYLWDFGDGNTAEGYDVEHSYKTSPNGYYDIILKVINPNGCVETDKKRIWITVPTKPAILTPNGDGVNDIFMKDTYLKLYNRNGILIYEGKDGWDGTFKNKTVSDGTYFYILTFTSELGVTTKNGYVTVVK